MHNILTRNVILDWFNQSSLQSFEGDERTRLACWFLRAAPDFYAKPRAEIFDLETQLKTARDKVAHLYARWHELELLQSASSPDK